MDAWWIDRPWVLGSDNPTTEDLEYLRSEGFEVLISLLHEDKQPPKYDAKLAKQMGFIRYSIPVEDFHPPTVDQLLEFARISGEITHKRKMLIHCQAGMGRTGAFAAAYWIAKGMPVADAIALVRKNRINAIETLEQEEVLESFAVRNLIRDQEEK